MCVRRVPAGYHQISRPDPFGTNMKLRTEVFGSFPEARASKHHQPHLKLLAEDGRIGAGLVIVLPLREDLVSIRQTNITCTYGINIPAVDQTPSTPNCAIVTTAGKPKSTSLSPPDLALWNRRDPAHHQVDCHGDSTDNPYRLVVIRAVVAKYDGEDYATEISEGSNEAGHDTCSVSETNPKKNQFYGTYRWQRGEHAAQPRNLHRWTQP